MAKEQTTTDAVIIELAETGPASTKVTLTAELAEAPEPVEAQAAAEPEATPSLLLPESSNDGLGNAAVEEEKRICAGKPAACGLGRGKVTWTRYGNSINLPSME